MQSYSPKIKVHFAVHINMECCTKSYQGKTIGLKESLSNTGIPIKIHIVLQLTFFIHCFNSLNTKNTSDGETESCCLGSWKEFKYEMNEVLKWQVIFLSGSVINIRDIKNFTI